MALPSELLLTTCDIYRGNPPGGAPAATNVPCQLVPDFSAGKVTSGLGTPYWTHSLVLATGVDIRDAFAGSQNAWNYANADTVFIPAGGTTAYVVVFVEVHGKSTANEYKRVYLDRQLPAWPAL